MVAGQLLNSFILKRNFQFVVNKSSVQPDGTIYPISLLITLVPPPVLVALLHHGDEHDEGERREPRHGVDRGVGHLETAGPGRISF